ncbi:MAG: ribosome maturation factor RimP [Corynebacterium sp.]|nr:ribosome maturation factor RimP [Corynebacterium sp.]
MADKLNDRVASLRAILEPLAQDFGVDIDNLTYAAAGKKSVVRIFIDADTRPDLDSCVRFSKICADALDEAEQKGAIKLPEGYTLEVGTPGVDRPLESPRHFRQNRGRLVKKGDKLYRLGALNDAGDAIIALEILKKSVKINELQLGELAGARVEIEFKEPPAEQKSLCELDFEEAAVLAAAEDEN